jgi:hypothetical protein
VSPRIIHVPINTTTKTKVKEMPIISSTEQMKITSKLFEHTNEVIITTESTTMMGQSNQTSRMDYSSSTFASIPSTIVYFDETTSEESNSTESNYDYTTINQANNEEQTHLTTVSTNENEEELSTVSIPTNHTRLFHLLANLTPHLTTEHPMFEIHNQTIIENTSTS